MKRVLSCPSTKLVQSTPQHHGQVGVARLCVLTLMYGVHPSCPTLPHFLCNILQCSYAILCSATPMHVWGPNLRSPPPTTLARCICAHMYLKRDSTGNPLWKRLEITAESPRAGRIDAAWPQIPVRVKIHRIFDKGRHAAVGVVRIVVDWPRRGGQ